MKSRKEQLEIELAFENGAEIEYSDPTINTNWKVIFYPNWQWKLFDYRIKEEPKRIPFCHTDIPNLLWKKFKHNNERHEEVICVGANEVGVILPYKKVSYEELAEHWLKWNDLTKEWQPCNKVA